jgi:general stress protein 26
VALSGTYDGNFLNQQGTRSMADEQKLQEKFWQALKSDRTMMLGLAGVDESHTRPMTAQLERDGGPIWFFTSIDSDLVKQLSGSHRVVATFASKGHDMFAAIHGDLVVDNDRAAIDRLWNRFVAAWYEGGKDDPKLVLLRFDTERAEIWEDGSSLWAGIKMLFGADPKQDYKENVADVQLK